MTAFANHTPVAGVKEDDPISSAEEMAAFDALPRILRDRLNESPVNLSAVDAMVMAAAP